MGFIMIIGLVLSGLNLLVNWLRMRQEKGKPVNERVLAKLNNVIFKMNEVRGLAIPMGAKPEGEPEPVMGTPSEDYDD